MSSPDPFMAGMRLLVIFVGVIACALFPPLLIIVIPALVIAAFSTDKPASSKPNQGLNYRQEDFESVQREANLRVRRAQESRVSRAEAERSAAYHKMMIALAEEDRREKNAQAGEEFTQLINETVERTGKDAEEILSRLRNRFQIPCAIDGGKLNVPEDQLERIELRLPSMRQYCASL